jgi:spermidine synthase
MYTLSFISVGKKNQKAGFVFREDVAPGLILEMSLNKIYHNTESEFQQIGVIDTYFGKTLVTDGKTQSAQFDEFAYHESLVHPALLNFAHYNKRGAKTVFIGGGGELATAREILRHTSVERVVMVDLDGKLNKLNRIKSRREEEEKIRASSSCFNILYLFFLTVLFCVI